MRKTTASGRFTEWFVFIALAVTYAFFWQGASSEGVSRFAASFGLATSASPTIDPFSSSTNDTVFASGHFYSTHGLGLSLLALPVVAVFQGTWGLENILRTPGRAELAYALATVFVVCLLCASSSAAFRRLLLHFRPTLTPRASLGITLLVYLGTPFLCYSTVFAGPAVAGALLTWAAWFALGDSLKSVVTRSILFQVAVALAVLVESRACFLVPALVAYLYQPRPTRRFRFQFPLIYIAVIFIGWWAYKSVASTPLSVNWNGLWTLWVGGRQGLLLYCPLAGLAIWGCVKATGPAREFLFAVLLGVVGIYLSSIFFPTTSSFAGPREFVLAIPFLFIGLAFLPLGARVFQLYGLLATLSISIAVVLTVVTPTVPADDPAPLWNTIGHGLTTGRVSMNPQGVLTPADKFGARWVHPELHTRVSRNLGELMGLRSWFSVIPLLLFWLLARYLVVPKLT